MGLAPLPHAEDMTALSSLPRPVRGRHRRRAAVLAIGVASVLAAPTVASAESIVFVQDANIWLAAPDGSNRYQVTTDGTAAQPYSSPSQADDGTIAASRGTEIIRMRQNGSVLNRMDPPPLINSVSHPVDGAPSAVAISPDGARIVYSLTSFECPIGVPGCGARPVTAITPADRMAPSGNIHTFGSSWVTNTRILTFAGFLHQVNTYDVGQAADVHWFDDQEHFGQGNSTDQSDGEVNRQGTYVATIRGYGNEKSVMWAPIVGDVATGSRAAGTLSLPNIAVGCLTSHVPDLAGPTWSPSGTALAWYEAGGIQVWDDATSCGGGSRMVIPGGSEPDWGPAAINPGPREGSTPPPSDPAPPKNDGTKKTKKGTTKAKLALSKRVKLRAALRSGLRLKLSGAKPGKRTITAKVGSRKVATGRAVVAKNGRATVTLRFSKAARKQLARRKSVALRISGAGTTLTLKVKR